MKVTRRELAQLIKEELDGLLNEVSQRRLDMFGTSTQRGYEPHIAAIPASGRHALPLYGPGHPDSWGPEGPVPRFLRRPLSREDYADRYTSGYQPDYLGVERPDLEQSVFDPEAGILIGLEDAGIKAARERKARGIDDEGVFQGMSHPGLQETIRKAVQKAIKETLTKKIPDFEV